MYILSHFQFFLIVTHDRSRTRLSLRSAEGYGRRGQISCRDRRFPGTGCCGGGNFTARVAGTCRRVPRCQRDGRRIRTGIGSIYFTTAGFQVHSLAEEA